MISFNLGKMIKLNFKVNKYCSAYSLVNKLNQLADSPGGNTSLGKLTKNLQKKLITKYQNNAAYYFIYLPGFKCVEWATDAIYLNKNDTSAMNNIKHLSRKIENIFKTIFSSREFKIILKQTLQYKNFVEKEWNQNKSFILNYLEEIIGKKLPNISITVNIVHPSLKKGYAIREKNLIIWGHLDDWQSYTLVYLTHELLHIVFNYYHIKPTEHSHALIELITDNELRIRLNQKGKYFREGRKHVGHPNLRQMEKQILPSWREYLQNKKKNLSLFLNQLKNKKCQNNVPTTNL